MSTTTPLNQSALDQMIQKLPSLSNVVSEFIKLSKREYLTGRDYERVISKDPALVARMLKMANSAYFSRQRKIGTITDALVLLGLDQVKKIVYAVSANGLLRRAIRNYAHNGEGIWLHSMAVAVTCRAMAGASTYGGLGGEEAFVAGLLHDIGKLVIDDFLDDYPGPREVLLEEEFAACGMDHAQLGGYVLGNWEFPETIVDAVRYHHDPYSGVSGESRVGDALPGAALVRMADGFCRTWRVGTDVVVDFSREIDLGEYRELMMAVGLNLTELAEVQEDLHVELEGLGEIYEVG